MCLLQSCFAFYFDIKTLYINTYNFFFISEKLSGISMFMEQKISIVYVIFKHAVA